MEYFRLGDLYKITKGKKVEAVEQSQDDVIRYIQIDDLRNNDNLKYCINDGKYVLAHEDDLIIAWDGANAGTIGYGLSGAIGSTLARLSTNSKEIYTPFIGRYMQAQSKTLRDRCTGATIPHIQKSVLEEIQIPKYDIDTQKEISKVLDIAQGLIDKRKEQIEACDELIKSQFIEMFGDPVSNPKNWDEQLLGELGLLGRGVSKHRPRNDPKLLGGIFPLIQTGDVANADLYISEYKMTYSELGLQQSKMWDKGTLCITIAANIAKTGILTFDACFPDSVVGFVANEKTNNLFMHYWFTFFQRILEEQAPESAQKNINLKILNELSVIIPPIELQNEFAQFVQQADKLKFEMEQSLTELENNFNSLMQKAFKGELF